MSLNPVERFVKHQEQVQFIIDNGINYLSDHEKEFIDGLELRLTSGRDTTFPQQKWLNSIYARIVERLG